MTAKSAAGSRAMNRLCSEKNRSKKCGGEVTQRKYGGKKRGKLRFFLIFEKNAVI